MVNMASPNAILAVRFKYDFIFVSPDFRTEWSFRDCNADGLRITAGAQRSLDDPQLVDT
jgi:hypothetical protein